MNHQGWCFGYFSVLILASLARKVDKREFISDWFILRQHPTIQSVVVYFAPIRLGSHRIYWWKNG